ncbi:hypothetical protein LZ32DRAFT_352429 [Colletotrichum eremochloae]|nr:hypothetical protein LZ32DRAFT_352429 [Colletotrichum eremochloae]
MRRCNQESVRSAKLQTTSLSSKGSWIFVREDMSPPRQVVVVSGYTTNYNPERPPPLQTTPPQLQPFPIRGPREASCSTACSRLRLAVERNHPHDGKRITCTFMDTIRSHRDGNIRSQSFESGSQLEPPRPAKHGQTTSRMETVLPNYGSCGAM